jgi:hypothetical protein
MALATIFLTAIAGAVQSTIDAGEFKSGLSDCLLLSLEPGRIGLLGATRLSRVPPRTIDAARLVHRAPVTKNREYWRYEMQRESAINSARQRVLI